MKSKDSKLWYAAGLHFQCRGCGNCCAGPGEGYIWVTKPEVQKIADLLEMSVDDFRGRYLRRVGLRTTIIEHPSTNDCIFLRNEKGRRICVIYPVRPTQCRTWPFWPCNLDKPSSWNEAGRNCPGMNRGRAYSPEEIQKIKKMKKWWDDSKD